MPAASQYKDDSQITLLVNLEQGLQVYLVVAPCSVLNGRNGRWAVHMVLATVAPVEVSGILNQAHLLDKT